MILDYFIFFTYNEPFQFKNKFLKNMISLKMINNMIFIEIL